MRSKCLPYALALAGVLVLSGCPAPSPGERMPGGAMAITHAPERLLLIGPDACRDCHLEEVRQWERSHHFHANRPIDRSLDRPRFSPERRLVDGNVKTRLYEADEGFLIEVQEADGSLTRARLEGVIAHDPLQQYLARFARGMWQATSAAFDPAHDEWFEVFPGENRIPGEWGHWTGRAMNWNANCAYCHMTEFEKNYAPATDSYASRWLQHGIGCVQCHSGLEQHVQTASPADPGIPPRLLSVDQQLDSCRSCHSHREQVTPDRFVVGDNYHDHFLLSLPDQPGLYFPDGQILEEVFVTGSFQMSRMGHAGVTCMDCHNPHSLELTLPINDNLVCLQCHAGGREGAPVIDPVAHSHHPAGSTGNLCVECHMPQTVYMQRDPRRDHGFLLPDPLLTRELGIPNACSGCHEQEGLDWVIDHAEAWHGERLAGSEQRRRARLLQRLHDGADDPEAGKSLLDMAESADNDAWRATYTGLMGRFLYLPEVREWLDAALSDPSPLVRQRAATAWSRHPEGAGPLSRLMRDDRRSVRLRAALALSQAIDPSDVIGQEWVDYIEFNSDRVGGALLLADHARRQGDSERARVHVRKAISLDSRSPEVHREAAVLMSVMGDDGEAVSILESGLRHAPGDPGLLYTLALLRAAEGRERESIELLRKAVDADPHFYRAWYNLSVGLARHDRIEEAAEALQRAAPGMQDAPEWELMRQYIEQRREQGRGQ